MFWSWKEVLGNKCDFFQSVASTRRNHHFYRTTHNVRNQYCWGPTFVARLRFVPGYARELLELQSNEHSSLLILRHITLWSLPSLTKHAVVTRWLLYANVLKENLNCKGMLCWEFQIVNDSHGKYLKTVMKTWLFMKEFIWSDIYDI